MLYENAFWPARLVVSLSERREILKEINMARQIGSGALPPAKYKELKIFYSLPGLAGVDDTPRTVIKHKENGFCVVMCRPLEWSSPIKENIKP